EEIADLAEIALLGELLDGNAAVVELALVAVDIGDGGLTAAGRGVAGVVGEIARLGIELAHVNDLGADRSLHDGQLPRLAARIVGERRSCPVRGGFGGSCVAFHRVCPCCSRCAAVRNERRSNWARRGQSTKCRGPRRRHFAVLAAASLSRASVSSRPSTLMISKSGGETVLPVSAARTGCATAPSFAPAVPAKRPTAPSKAPPCHSARAAT